MNIKTIRINDYVTVPYKGSRLHCPVSGVSMTESDLSMIMNCHGVTPPAHIYAVCPKDKTVIRAITRENFRMTNDEIFPEFYNHVTPPEPAKDSVEFKAKSFINKIKETETSKPVEEAPVEVIETVDDTASVVEEVAEEVNDVVNDTVEVVTETQTDDATIVVEEPETMTATGTTFIEADKKEEVVAEEVNETVESSVVEVINDTEVTTADTPKTTNNNYNKNKKKKRK